MKILSSQHSHASACTALTLSLAFTSPMVLAIDNCKQFTLTSNVTLLSPAGPAVGTAEAILEDGTVLFATAEGEIESSKVGDDGTIHMQIREVDQFGPFGTTLGLDKVKLFVSDVPGEYSMNIKTNIVGDTGLLEDVYGLYHGKGSASFNSMSLTHSGEGKICNLPF